MPTQGNKRKPSSSNNADSTVKRSRVSRACDQCRTAREKCDGVQPVCFTCTASKRDCTYTANPKKRGIQPGYIRSLELALTWLFQNTDSEAILNKKLAQEGTSSVLLGRDTKESNKLHKSWRRSRFCKDIDKLLSGEEISINGLDNSRTPESDEEDTDTESTGPNLQYQLSSAQPQEEVSLIRQRRYPKTRSPNIASVGMTQQDSGAARSHYPVSMSIPPQQDEVLPRAYPTTLPSNRWRLFDIYFAYTNCWLPISEKHDVLKLTYSYPEHGLVLSASKLPNSGDHAELWSILALASIQELQTDADANTAEPAPHYTPTQLYDIARALVPLEQEAFHLGHVKALLILALFNMSQSAPEAAWIMVGHASRIIICLERNESPQTLRFQHVFAGCFLLDTLISLQLRRRPYLRTLDVDRIGKVNEDGLEEWQPWTGCLGLDERSNLRTPVFGLSTFNNLVQIAGILGSTRLVDTSTPSIQEVIGRIELWKASLPPTLEYLKTEHIATPTTPPALLLQLIYHCSSLMVFSSHSWMLRILEIVEHFQNALGIAALPPILHCLLDIVQGDKAFDTLDRRVQERYHNLHSELTQAWKATSQLTAQGLVSSYSKRSLGSSSTHYPKTPESIQIPYNSSLIPINNSTPDMNRPRTSSTLLDDLLPDMNPTSAHLNAHPMDFHNALPIQNFDNPQFEHAFNAPLSNHRNSNASRDIENFFDELASLDGAERMENQPQFMQNLGFAPDANMADLLSAEFGQFASLNSAYMPHSGSDATHLDPSTFYDGP